MKRNAVGLTQKNFDVSMAPIKRHLFRLTGQHWRMWAILCQVLPSLTQYSPVSQICAFDRPNRRHLAVSVGFAAIISFLCVGTALGQARVDLEPIALAGADQSVTGASTIILDGSGSYDPEDTQLVYNWTQTSGPAVAINNADSAVASFGVSNMTAPTDFKFRLKIGDNSGERTGRSAIDFVTITVLPPANPNLCSPWNRDKLMASLSVEQPNGSGTNYSLKHVISGRSGTELLAEAQRLSTIYPDFKTLEIKSSISPAGAGPQPVASGGQVPNAPPIVLRFELSVLPVPTLTWMGAPFTENDWYRLDTKLNVYDAAGDFISTHTTYADNCLYETLYLKLDGSGNLDPAIRAARPQLVFSDGDRVIGSRPGILPGNRPRVRRSSESFEGGQRKVILTKDETKKSNEKIKKRWGFWKRKKKSKE